MKGKSMWLIVFMVFTLTLSCTCNAPVNFLGIREPSNTPTKTKTSTQTPILKENEVTPTLEEPKTDSYSGPYKQISVIDYYDDTYPSPVTDDFTRAKNQFNSDLVSWEITQESISITWQDKQGGMCGASYSATNDIRYKWKIPEVLNPGESVQVGARGAKWFKDTGCSGGTPSSNSNWTEFGYKMWAGPTLTPDPFNMTAGFDIVDSQHHILEDVGQLPWGEYFEGTININVPDDNKVNTLYIWIDYDVAPYGSTMLGQIYIFQRS